MASSDKIGLAETTKFKGSPSSSSSSSSSSIFSKTSQATAHKGSSNLLAVKCCLRTDEREMHLQLFREAQMLLVLVQQAKEDQPQRNVDLYI
jgi:hypothetical protein